MIITQTNIIQQLVPYNFQHEHTNTTAMSFYHWDSQGLFYQSYEVHGITGHNG